MRTSYKRSSLVVRPQRTLRAKRVLRPIAGQCFEIDIRLDGSRWIILIPEINEATEAETRSAVETAARESIAAHTGIPIGYISVWCRD